MRALGLLPGLPTSSAFVDQITEFIENQVGGFTLGGDAGFNGGGPVDPLSGAGAYVPGSAGPTGTGGYNPWAPGMNGGYVPPPEGQGAMDVDGGGGYNPWLPSDRYVPGQAPAMASAAERMAQPVEKQFPVKT
eukprot:SAG22_NODE_35_length_27276_cov_20.395849_12_plen_133_part_00